MVYNDFLLGVNVVTVAILLMIGLLLCFVARFKGESSYAVLIIFLTTLPSYIYNIFTCLEWNNMALYVAPLGYSANLLLMPFLFFLVQRGFNPYYSFRLSALLHFIPAVSVFAVIIGYMISLPSAKISSYLAFDSIWEWGKISIITFVCQLVQLMCYLYVIFRYLHRVKHYLCNHYSAAELLRKVWIPRFIGLFAMLFTISMIVHIIWPHTYAWLNQLLNVITVGYLLYSELDIAFYERYNVSAVVTPLAAAEAESEFIKEEIRPQPVAEGANDDMEILVRYAQQIKVWIEETQAFINPNLSLKDVSVSTGISSKNLSKAINNVLDKNFFELINSYRVEKSKGLLMVKKEKGLTLETIAEQCGFNSRFTFTVAFKKATGITTSEWLKNNMISPNTIKDK